MVVALPLGVAQVGALDGRGTLIPLVDSVWLTRELARWVTYSEALRALLDAQGNQPSEPPGSTESAPNAGSGNR